MLLIILGIIFLQLFVSTYFMAYQKTGFFADDLYSYGFSNSPNTTSPLETNEIINHNLWLDSSVLNDYLTVSHDERFTFGRITETLKRDAHPPLFYFILHFFCSLTPNVFSAWSAYIINVFGFILLQIYLYRLSLLIGRNRLVALLIIFFFGFTSASINMMVLLRMYMLATGFTVAYSFYSLRYLLDHDNSSLLNTSLLLSFVFLYLSTMTVYLSTLFAFFLTFYICSFLLMKKRLKKMFCYGISMLFSVGAMCLSFPVVFDQLFSDKYATAGADLYPFMLQFRTCIYVISNGVFGISTPIFPTMIPFYIISSLLALVIIYAIIHFIFRNDKWFTDCISGIKHSLGSFIKKSVPYLYSLIPFFIIVLCFLVLYSRKLKIFYFKEYGMRYFYILTPFITMIIMIILLKPIKKTFIRILLILILSLVSLLFGSKCYLEKQLDSQKIAKYTANSDVIVVENDYSYFMYHIIELLDCNTFLYSTPKDVFEGKVLDPLLEKNQQSDSIVLIVDHTATSMDSMTVKSYNSDGSEVVLSDGENDIFDYFRSISGFENAVLLGSYYGSYVYRLK